MRWDGNYNTIYEATDSARLSHTLSPRTVMLTLETFIQMGMSVVGG